MKQYIKYLFQWVIHRNDRNSDNPSVWTYDEFTNFRVSVRNGTIILRKVHAINSVDAHSNDLKPEIIHLLKITNLGGFGTSKDPIAFAYNQAGYHDFDTFRTALQDFSIDDFSYNEKVDKSGEEIAISTSH